MKRLPYEKTVVTEIKVQLADLLSRTVSMKSSVAAAIPTTSTFNSGDTTITWDKPLQLEVGIYVALSSLENFNVVMRSDTADIEMKCTGLFVFNGAAGRIWVRPPIGVEAVRLQYIWA